MTGSSTIRMLAIAFAAAALSGSPVWAGTSQAGSPTTDVGAACGAEPYSCGPQNELGQDTINVCSGGVWVKLDNCDDDPNNACGIIGGNPYCVAPSAAKTTAVLTSDTAAAAPGAAPTTNPAAGGSAGTSLGGAPTTALGASCNGQTYSCGPQNDVGQDTINVCSGGVWVKLDNCDDDPNNACTLIGGNPFCVLPTSAAATTAAAGGGTSPTTSEAAGSAVTTSQAAASSAGTSLTGAPTTALGASCNGQTYSCGPQNEVGQDTINVCSGGVWVKLDNCDDVPNIACTLIGGNPFCVLPTSAAATTAAAGGATSPTTSAAAGSAVTTSQAAAASAGTSLTGSPTTALGASCNGQTYSCGPQNDVGQDTINVCSGGVWVKLDNCDDVPNIACTLIGGNPFCVLPTSAAATTAAAGGGTSPTTSEAAGSAVTTSQAAAASAGTSLAGAPTTALGASCNGQTYSCGPQNDVGQDTINVCSGGVWVKLDNCDDDPNNACTLIGGSPFCVAPTSGAATTAAAAAAAAAAATPNQAAAAAGTSLAGSPTTAVGASCNGQTYSCGPQNDIGQDTINVCSGGVWVKLDNCDDDPNNACTLIGGSPFCVAPTSVVSNTVTPVVLPSSVSAAVVTSSTSDLAVGNKGGVPSAETTSVSTVSSTSVQFGGSCTSGAYACGPINDAGQGTIAICQDGAWVKLDDCNDKPYNTCEITNSVPYCVAGTNLAATSTTSTPTFSSTTTISNSVVTPTAESSSTASAVVYTTSTSSVVATPTTSSGNGGKNTVDPNTAYGAQGLTACQYDMLLQITSIFETSSTTLNYGICGDIGDGNGFSAGCVQFTTESGSALKVVENYLQTNPSSALASFVSGLQAVVGSGTTSTISGFCAAWSAAAAADPTGFGASQRAIASQYYLAPNADLVSSLGLTTATGVGQIMDCAIQLGLGGCSTIAAATSATKPANGGNEATYLNAFLDARINYINMIGGAYAATGYRVTSYRHIVQSGNLDFANNQVEALDNGGGVVTITCSI
ncbi:hypothetical protein HK405_009228 [Cladochytrium tenue]|nr:hypothetical protein HK405_009228 [Cladochytrium tenue]